MNSFIPWVGGKSKLLWIINKMAPDHYSRFIDVFGGSGTVTMSRPIQPGCMEVYNDFNSNLTNLFCCVKNRPLALLAELGLLPLNTRDDFNVLYKFLSKGEITDDYLQEEMELTEILLKPPEAEATFDEYFKGETAFERAGKKITPKLLLEAIRTLPEEKRKAVLLYYFEGMNDTEIAELFDTSRSTIQYRRTSSFELLKKYLEENADEWDEW